MFASQSEDSEDFTDMKVRRNGAILVAKVSKHITGTTVIFSYIFNILIYIISKSLKLIKVRRLSTDHGFGTSND